jgi:hypothetical protein
MISTHISKSNNNSKCEQSLNRNKSQIFFHGQFWLLKNNSFLFSLHEMFPLFELIPNAYGISKFSFQFGERNENLKKWWTHQVDNQNDGIINEV